MPTSISPSRALTGSFEKFDHEPLPTADEQEQVECVLARWPEICADDRFAEQWDSLALNATEPNAFAERWYLEAALRSLDPRGKVRLAVVSASGRLIGIMPVCEEGHYAGFALPNKQNWLNPNAFLGTPLILAGAERRFWRILLKQLDLWHEGALFFHLTAMTTDGPIALALEAECKQQGRRFALFQREERAFLEHGMSPATYLDANLRAKKRKELRRQHKRLSELGDLQLDRSNGRERLDAWIDEFLALERRGWKGSNGSALDCDDKTRSLFRGALHGAANEGKLELLALRLDGRAIAMLVNFLTPPGAFSFKTAFDEDYARFSPGVLLQIHNLALLEREGIEWCDSCAVQDHPMIDSIWSGRRAIGRYSVAIGGPVRRAGFAILLAAEKAKGRLRQVSSRKIIKDNEMST
ncbi:MAG: GNAT family N-acetyltransferase [Sphingorhabdus sp.]